MARPRSHGSLLVTGAGLVTAFLLAQAQPASAGTAELCVFRSGRFLCDTAHDGGQAELKLSFGQRGDFPLLADFNGDGTADPCVLHDHHFRCDIARAGAAELKLDMRAALDRSKSGTPLLGDVDGDGRADPCVFDRGRLICGIFKPGGGKPVRVLTLNFGKAGDLPVLGDVDGL